MNVFVIIRRSLWGIILAALATVGCVYMAVSATILSEANLQNIAKEAGAAQIVRTKMILPRITTFAQQSDYSALFDASTITKAFNEAVPDGALASQLDPAISSLHAWLDSKQPDITFTLKSDDLSQKFNDSLIRIATEKVAALPACTYENELTDAEYGICRQPGASPADIKASVTEVIKNEPLLRIDTITADDITLPKNVVDAGKDIPNDINMLYALSLLTGGLALIVALWLISKHRLSGLITIGGAGILVAITLFVGSNYIPVLSEALKDSPLAYDLATALTRSVPGELRQLATYLALGGAITILLISGLKVLLAKRHAKHTKK